MRKYLKDELLQGYRRDRQHSQPNHIELVCEKNTIASLLRPTVRELCIPMVSGRGFASLPPRERLKARFERSGKEKLVIIMVTDFDPSGCWICDSYPRSMRDDFGLEVEAHKAALTYEQVRQGDLPSSLEVDYENNTHAKWFVEMYGPDQKPYELEALAPGELIRLVRHTIMSVIDMRAYNAEVRQEARG